MERRRKSVGGGYENSCHDFDSFKTVHHSKKSLRNFDVIPPCSEATAKNCWRCAARNGRRSTLQVLERLERLQ